MKSLPQSQQNLKKCSFTCFCEDDVGKVLITSYLYCRKRSLAK